MRNFFYLLLLGVVLVTIAIVVRSGMLARKGELRLKATARYSDGAIRDVTSQALFESNDKAMAEVSDAGVVKAQDLPGKVAIMVRFQGQVAVCNAAIPMGAPVTAVPPARNFVDEALFANLRDLGIPPSPVCDDATFLRRIHLDTVGLPPTEREARAFLADPAPDKREKLIDRLLAETR